MVDNRYATALVIGSVLSLLATVYLSVAVGTQHWYQYRSPPGNHEASNASELREDFIKGEFDEKAYSDTLFRLNGTLGLWWRCVQAPGQSHWFKEPDPKMVTQCVSFTLPQQFLPKYKEPGNHNTGEDLLRTCLCSLGTVCCFLAGMDLLHRVSVLPDGVDGSLGWSLYLALISSPLEMMAAALFLWAARSHRQNYTRMTAYRVA
uniref:claudin domain-containing protein 1-like isoform X2 n=1 Tax=Oncorhynchus gorbuscha TaxID=8017 RepID=UPI001EAF0772|nr:claudin domain-containing protein 1-like isoform X2 [Oncorhynchus gorbuscha]